MVLPQLSNLWRNIRSRGTVVLPNTGQIERIEGSDELRPGQEVFRIGEWMQEPLNERVDIQNQMPRERLNHIAIAHDDYERLNHISIVYTDYTRCNRIIKKPLLDLLYPHECKNPLCNRTLYFNDLLVAKDNNNIKTKFIDEIFEFLTEHYSQFGFPTRDKWSDIFGNFEFRQYLRKLWKNKNVEFYCCSCVKKAEKGEIQDDGRIVIKKLEKKDGYYYGEPVHLQIERNDSLDALSGPLEELQNHFINNICVGAGLTREELFGEREPSNPQPHTTEDILNELYDQSDYIIRDDIND